MRGTGSGAPLWALLVALGCASPRGAEPAPPPTADRRALEPSDEPAEAPARPPSEPSRPARSEPEPGVSEPPRADPTAAPPVAPAPPVDELREAVRLTRRDADRACRGRRAQSAECELAHVALLQSVATLATALGCRLEPRRLQAIERLEGLVEAVAEARDAIDPHAFSDCVREGGDEADCELIAGQADTELGAAEHALEQAYAAASADRIRDDCAPADDDLVVQVE